MISCEAGDGPEVLTPRSSFIRNWKGRKKCDCELVSCLKFFSGEKKTGKPKKAGQRPMHDSIRDEYGFIML